MRWKCTCAYDGTDFDGWQRQPSGGAVQNHIEAALTQIFDLPLQLHGSGRTDAGVHARGQCFHFDAEWLHEAGKANSCTSFYFAHVDTHQVCQIGK
jgi:tRNA pseudouridine38-40 synthase